MSETPGDQLLVLLGSAEAEALICAPFVKLHALSRLLDVIDSAARIELFTRWRPEEVAAGVSDTSVLAVVEDRGGSVWLHDQLHAKVFRADGQVLVGSANVTGKALGWSS